MTASHKNPAVLTNQTIDPTKVGAPKPFILLRPFIAAWEWLVPPSQAHRDRQSKLARWVAGGLVILVSGTLITLAIMYAKPAQDVYQNWQAEKLVKESRRLADDGQGLNAFLKAQQAVAVAPDNINAIRLNGEILTLMKRNEALFFLEKLESKGAATSSDKQTKIRALLNLNRAKEASQELEELLVTEAPTDATMKLAERVWGERQQNTMLMEVLKRYSRRHPDDKLNLLRLAKVQVGSNMPNEVSAGIKIAWELSTDPEEIGLQALEFLDTLTVLPPDEIKRLIGALENHPKASGWTQVAALKRKLQTDPGHRREIIAKAIERWRGKQREELEPFVRWLVTEGEFLQVVSVVDEAQVKGYQPLLENYLTALTMLKRFSDLERLIKDPAVTAILPKSVSAFYRAHLAFVTGKPPEEVRTALIAAKLTAEGEGRGELMLALAKYAEERGHNDIAEEGYRAASLLRRTERDGFKGLIRTSEINGNTEGMFLAARDGIRRWPDDQSYMEKYLYASLLSGRELELSLKRVHDLLDAQPKDNPRKLMAALACWRLQDTAQALAHLQHMNLNFLSPGQQAVFAVIAKEGGFPAEAKGVIAAIDPKAPMLPEERACYQRALE